MNDNDKTVRNESVPPASSGTHEQGANLLETGMMQPPQTPGTLGTIGKYQVVRILGEGGMGQVLLAREPVTDSLVAVKIIKPEYLKKEWAVHRFLTEARHMFKMSHPSIIRVHEVSDRPDCPFFVMPFMAGGSLAQKIKPGEALPPDTILSLARQVAEALQYAHARGIIHRDLKTSNILLDPEGRAYLCDFGLLRTVFNDSMVDVTKPQVEGTVPYMSPAIAGGKAEDTRCDIYAFGCLLYEMLTGQPPYQGPTVDAILKQIVAGPPQPIRQLNPNAPAHLVAIAEHAMGRELRDRYAAMSDLINDLDRAAQGKEPLGPHGRANGAHLRRNVLAAIGIVTLLGLTVFGISKLPGLKSSSLLATALDQFTWTTNNGAITITKYIGPGGAVTIPNAINGLPVTCIRTYSFASCGALASVTIPSSVTSIEGGAFWDSGIKTSVRIPASVTSIGGNPFAGSAGLPSFTVDPANPAYSTVDGILFNKDKTRLVGCPGSKTGSYRIPNTVTNVGALAFCGCKLTSVTIPDSVTAIGGWAFERCGLSTVTIPSSVTAIGEAAFNRCSGLTNVTLGKGVNSLGPNLFFGSPKLLTIMVDALNPAYSTAEGVLFNKDRTCLVGYPGGKAGSYVIPNGVTKINGWAFRDCTYLTSVTIPDSIADIDTRAFIGCYNLTGIYFKGNAPRLGEDVFEGVKKATVHWLPGTTGWAQEFGGHPTAQWNPQAMDNTLPAATAQHQFAWTTNNGAITITKYTGPGGEVSIPDKINGLPVTAIAYTAFAFRSDLTSVTIPDSVVTIGPCAFYCCAGLTNITIPKSVTSIDFQAFAGCSSLMKLEIPKGVTFIGRDWFGLNAKIVVDAANPAYSSTADGVLFDKSKTCLVHYPARKAGSYAIPACVKNIMDGAFNGCQNLTNITIPASVTNIGHGAFAACTSLASVTIPAGVTSMGRNPFRGGRSGITSIKVDAANPAFSSSADGVVFNKEKTCLVSYPGGKAGSYEIPNGITRIGQGAFDGCTYLTSVIIPESVTAIDEWAFSGCQNLTGVYSKGNAPRLGQDVFAGIKKATIYYLPETKGWGPEFGGFPTAPWMPSAK